MQVIEGTLREGARSRDAETALEAAAAEALRKARNRQLPVVLRVHRPLPAGGLHLPEAPDSRIFDSLSLSGGSLATGLSARGCALAAPHREGEGLAGAITACSLDRELLLESGPGADGLPLWVGGAACDVGATPEGPWWGWPALGLWIPERIVYARAGRWGELAHVAVAPTDTLARVLERVAAARTEAVPAVRPTLEHVDGRGHRGRERWCRAVTQTLDAIEAGEVHKVVLARAAHHRAGDGRAFDANATLRALRERHPGDITFAVRHAGATFVGATPELLVEVKGRRLTTEALAGTIGRASEPDEDARRAATLLASEKDRREHEVVARTIVARLDRIARQVERSFEPEVATLAKVHHLRTPIAATLRRGLGVLDAVARLHPTPAVGGSPTTAANEFRRRHEALERGWYAGPIGWIAPNGDGAFAVALRSALIRGDHAWAFAGAGIVAGSVAPREWEETELKLSTIADALRVTEVTL